MYRHLLFAIGLQIVLYFCFLQCRFEGVIRLYLPPTYEGMGAKSLRAGWDPTLRLLLETRKTIVCTAHGDKDLADDLNFINRVSSEEDSQDMGEPLEFLIPPHLNPFRSLKRLVDRVPGSNNATIVTSNCYLYALRSK